VKRKPPVAHDRPADGGASGELEPPQLLGGQRRLLVGVGLPTAFFQKAPVPDRPTVRTGPDRAPRTPIFMPRTAGVSCVRDPLARRGASVETERRAGAPGFVDRQHCWTAHLFFVVAVAQGDRGGGAESRRDEGGAVLAMAGNGLLEHAAGPRRGPARRRWTPAAAHSAATSSATAGVAEEYDGARSARRRGARRRWLGSPCRGGSRFA
jgi:hypothetical protein